MSKVTYYSQACYKVLGFQQMSEEFIRRKVWIRSSHRNGRKRSGKLSSGADEVFQAGMRVAVVAEPCEVSRKERQEEAPLLLLRNGAAATKI